MFWKSVGSRKGKNLCKIYVGVLRGGSILYNKRKNSNLGIMWLESLVIEINIGVPFGHADVKRELGSNEFALGRYFNGEGKQNLEC